jgi:hypothetical protein
LAGGLKESAFVIAGCCGSEEKHRGAESQRWSFSLCLICWGRDREGMQGEEGNGRRKLQNPDQTLKPCKSRRSRALLRTGAMVKMVRG